MINIHITIELMLKFSKSNQYSIFGEIGYNPYNMKKPQVTVLVGDYFETLANHIFESIIVSSGVGQKPQTDLISHKALIEVKAHRHTSKKFLMRKPQFDYYCDYKKRHLDIDIYFFLFEYKIGVGGIKTLTQLKTEDSVIGYLSDNIGNLIIFRFSDFYKLVKKQGNNGVMRYNWGGERVYSFNIDKVIKSIGETKFKNLIKIEDFILHGVQIKGFDIIVKNDYKDEIKRMIYQCQTFENISVPEYEDFKGTNNNIDEDVGF